MRKHYWWRYLLFVLLGFFLGIGSVVGGIAAAGFFVKGQDIENWTGQDLFTDDYQGKNMVELISSLIKNEDQDLDTLGGLAKISPKVDELVDNINQMFKQQIGYSWPKEELYQVKFDQIGNWMVQNLKDNATVATMIGADQNSSSIMKLILFPKSGGDYDYDHPYTLTDFMTTGFFDGIINQMVLRDVLGDIDPSNKLLTAIADWTLDDLKDEDKLFSLTITDLMGEISADNTLLYAIRNWTINDLKDEDKIFTLTITDLMGEISSDNTLLYAIRNWTINDLKDEDKVYGLTITEIMGEISPDNSLLYAIRNWTINDLKDEDKIYDELLVKDLVGDIDPDNTLLVAIQNWTIRELMDDEKVNGLTIEELFGTVDEGNAILYAFKDMTISQFKDKAALDAKVNDLKLSQVISDIPSDNSFLNAVKDWKISDLKDTDKINALTISEVLGDIPADNSFLNAVKTWTINDLKDPDKVNALTVNEILGDIPADNSFLNAIKDWTINDLKDKDNMNSLTIREILGDDDINASQILTAIADIEIGNLKDEIDTLPLNSFIDTSGNKILSLVGTSPINEIPTAVNNLTFAQIIDKDALNGNESLYNYLASYTIGEIDDAFRDMTIGAIINDDTGIFKHLDKTRNISELGDAVKELKVVDAFEEEIFNEDTTSVERDNCTMKVIWKFMLTPGTSNLSPDGTLYGVDPNKAAYETYTVGDGMGDMVSNFEAHVNNEDLNTLCSAGLVEVPAGFLTKPIPAAGITALTLAGVDMAGRTLYGELRVNELTIVLNAL